jgi:hypothetical protein
MPSKTSSQNLILYLCRVQQLLPVWARDLARRSHESLRMKVVKSPCWPARMPTSRNSRPTSRTLREQEWLSRLISLTPAMWRRPSRGSVRRLARSMFSSTTPAAGHGMGCSISQSRSSTKPWRLVRAVASCVLKRPSPICSTTMGDSHLYGGDLCRTGPRGRTRVFDGEVRRPRDGRIVGA